MAIFVIISNGSLFHAALGQAGEKSSSEFYPVVNYTCTSYESKTERKLQIDLVSLRRHNVRGDSVTSSTLVIACVHRSAKCCGTCSSKNTNQFCGPWVFFKLYLKNMVSYFLHTRDTLVKQIRVILRRFDISHSQVSEHTSLLHSESWELTLY